MDAQDDDTGSSAAEFEAAIAAGDREYQKANWNLAAPHYAEAAALAARTGWPDGWLGVRVLERLAAGYESMRRFAAAGAQSRRAAELIATLEQDAGQPWTEILGGLGKPRSAFAAAARVLRSAGDFARANLWVEDTLDLAPGDVIESEVGGWDIVQETPTLGPGFSFQYTLATARTRVYRFRLATPGVFHFALKSYYFDSYLVVRDSSGQVIAEDDDGLFHVHSCAVATLEADTDYYLEPTGLHGSRGPFRLEIRAGTPPVLSRVERNALELQDALDRLAFVDAHSEESTRSAFFLLAETQKALLLQDRRDALPRLMRRQIQTAKDIWGEAAAYATALENLASELKRRGRTAECGALREQVYAVRRRWFGEDSDAAYVAAAYLADHLIDVGDVERARTLLEGAEDRVRRNGNGPINLAGPTNSALYRLQVLSGELEEALDSVEQWIAASENSRVSLDVDGGLYVGYHLKRAELSCRLGDPHTALESLRAAREQAARQPTAPRWAADLDRWEAVATAMVGAPEDALELWTASHAVVESIAPDTEMTATSRAHGAWYLAACFEVEEALDHALAALTWNFDHEDSQFGAVPEAHRMRRSEHRSTIGLAVTLAEDAARVREVYEHVVRWKGRFSRAFVTSRDRALASLDEETIRSLEDLRVVQGQLSAAFWDPPGEARDRRLDRLRAQRIELEVKIGEATQELRSAQRPVGYDELRQALPRGSVLIDFLVHVRPDRPFPVEVDDEPDPVHLAAWVVRADAEDPIQIDLGSAAPIQRACEQFLTSIAVRAGLDRGVRPRTGSAASESPQKVLFERLWTPLAEHVGEAHRVFLSPDGFLGTVPFETIVDGREHLIERHAFVYLQDATSLARAGVSDALAPVAGSTATDPSDRPAADSLLVVAGVDYDDAVTADEEFIENDAGDVSPVARAQARARRAAAFGAWSPLQFAAVEGEDVAGLYGSRQAEDAPSLRLLLGADATEPLVKALLPGRRYVHFATHGFFAPAEADDDATQAALMDLMPGLLSGLVLAGANRASATTQEDGLLTAEEVTWLDLRGCDLVTLSACQTALGTARGGEGMAGLRRAFRLAGARTVISSLWSVDDEKTRGLMERFYRHLWIDRQPVGDALRNAQLELLREERARSGGAAPGAWGAFVLSGAWE